MHTSPWVAISVLCIVLSGCNPREQPASSTEPTPSSSAPITSASSIASSAPVVSSVPANEPPQPIGGILRSPLSPEPQAQCPTKGEFPQVIVREGNILLCLADGVQESLTTSGKDDTPSLSPKRDAVVFLRSVGMTNVSLGGGDSVSIHDNRVRLIRLKDRKEREIGRPSESQACLSLTGPKWLDDNAVLVQSNGYEAPTIHNLSACLIDVRLEKIFNIARRTSCAMLVTAGRFKGHLFVAPWNFKIGEGLSPWYGVVNRRGQRLHSFEDNPFERDWNGDGDIMNEETAPECLDLSAHRAEVEKIMRGW